jgi:hypothetical protein
MLRQRNRRFSSYLGARCGTIDHEDHFFASGLDELDSRSYGTKVMWAWARRYQHQIRHPKNRSDHVRHCRWCVNDGQLDTGLVKGLQVVRQVVDRDAREEGGFGSTLVPPGRE